MNLYRNTSRSAQLLRSLIQEQQHLFRFEEALRALPTSSEPSVRQLLLDMVERGLLYRIKPGLYHIIPWDQNPDFFRPTIETIVRHIVEEPYYLGYESAFLLHTRPEENLNAAVIVAPKQYKDQSLAHLHIDFRFLKENCFFGVTTLQRNGHTLLVSDPEKTMADFCFQPHHAGTETAFLEMIRTLLPLTDRDKLLQTLLRFEAPVVLKRAGWAIEEVEGITAWSTALHKHINSTAAFLDLGPSPKRRYPRWRIQVGQSPTR